LPIKRHIINRELILNQYMKEIPFVIWKACTAHLSAASLTGVLLSFKHSASAGPIMETWTVIDGGLA
jgi:hypothetical protein